MIKDKDLFRLSHITRTCNFPLQVACVAIYQRNDYILENLQPDNSYLSFVWKTEHPADLILNGNTIPLHSPYMVLVTPEDTVRLSPQTLREETFFQYSVPCANIKEFNLQNCFFQLTPRMEKLRGELNHLLHTLSVPGNADRVDLLAMQMAQEAMLNKINKKIHSACTLPNEKIFQVARKIEMHFDTDLDIEKEIRQAGLGRRTFYREWNKFFTDTPKKYLLELRFDKAQTLLANTSKSVAEISELCGFNNVAYFIHSFRKSHGMTPGDFRKEIPKS